MANEESLKVQPSPTPLMTEAAFVEELLALIKRGEEAGLNTTTLAIRVGWKRGVGFIDGIFADVEKNIGSGKKGG